MPLVRVGSLRQCSKNKTRIWNLATRERRRQPIKKARRVAARLQEANLIHACHDERETSNPTAPTHAASPKQAATDTLRLRLRLQPDLHRQGDRLVAAPCPSFRHSHVASPCYRSARRSSWTRAPPRRAGVMTLRSTRWRLEPRVSQPQADQSLSSPPARP